MQGARVPRLSALRGYGRLTVELMDGHRTRPRIGGCTQVPAVFTCLPPLGSWWAAGWRCFQRRRDGRLCSDGGCVGSHVPEGRVVAEPRGVGGARVGIRIGPGPPDTILDVGPDVVYPVPTAHQTRKKEQARRSVRELAWASAAERGRTSRQGSCDGRGKGGRGGLLSHSAAPSPARACRWW